MTIDEAIANLSIQIEGKHPLAQKHQAEAIKLGIESLIRVRDNRVIVNPGIQHLLPGETKE